MAYHDPIIGKTLLGRYRIARRLARGGMGVVYLARAEGAAGFAKPVVVKRMLTEIADDAMEQMFVREARILSRLQHPNIVSVIDFGQEDGAYLLVMEYVHGYHLGRWERYVRAVRDPIPVDLCLHIVIKLLEALHYAHTRKRPDGGPLEIVHRDVTPSNVFIDADGHVKLLDFGIARMTGDTDEYKTQEATVKGKLAYLPPEIFEGSHATPKTDVYSCGVLLHELLVGRNAFRAQEMSTTLHNVLTVEPTRPSEVRKSAPRKLDDVVAKAMAKHPDARFDDAEQLALALRELRSISEEEADEQLAKMVAEDFSGDIAERLAIPSLDELEGAWRSPPPASDPNAETDPPPGPESDPPTQTLPAPGRGARGRLVGIVLGIALVAAAGIAVALSLERAEDGGPELVVIQQTSADGPEGAGDGTAPSGDSDAGGSGDAAVAGAVAAGPEPEAGGRQKARPAPAGARLSAAFARRGPEVEACFDSHARDVTGSPRIAIRFEVDAAGAVEDAQLSPDELAGTDLGTCLLRVARSTRFPARDTGAAFRIPITARRH